MLKARYGPAPVSAAEFEARPIAVDAYVVTPGALRSPLATAIPRLAQEKFWVWKVLRIIPAGSQLPSNSLGHGTAKVDVYEAQVHAPARPGLGSQWQPCWDKLSRKVFLYTRAEKARRELRKSRRLAGSEGSAGSATGKSDEPVYEPLVAFLRAANVYGSGFFFDWHLAGAKIRPRVCGTQSGGGRGGGCRDRGIVRKRARQSGVIQSLCLSWFASTCVGCLRPQSESGGS